jgi:hypothetical protein
MPEIVAIMELPILPFFSTQKEADQSTLDDILFIGSVQTLALELGARKAEEPPKMVAFLDPPDQLGHRPRRRHQFYGIPYSYTLDLQD